MINELETKSTLIYDFGNMLIILTLIRGIFEENW